MISAADLRHRPTADERVLDHMVEKELVEVEKEIMAAHDEGECHAEVRIYRGVNNEIVLKALSTLRGLGYTVTVLGPCRNILFLGYDRVELSWEAQDP